MQQQATTLHKVVMVVTAGMAATAEAPAMVGMAPAIQATVEQLLVGMVAIAVTVAALAMVVMAPATQAVAAKLLAGLAATLVPVEAPAMAVTEQVIPPIMAMQPAAMLAIPVMAVTAATVRQKTITRVSRSYWEGSSWISHLNQIK